MSASYARMRLPISESNILSRTVSKLSQTKIGHSAFLYPLFGGLGATYDVHLRLI